MRSFFDTALIEKHGTAFIREERVTEGLNRLIPRAHISKGSYSCPGYAEPRDLAWNHMDQQHRPFVHRTYGAAMRIAIADRSAFSLTRFGNWPAVIPVFDGNHKDNGFYQILCLFGVIVVVCVIECNATERGTQMDISWVIASHRWLRFLHPMLNRRLVRLNVVQNDEDAEIRRRRVTLRRLGYRFTTDSPDFVSANALGNNVIFPKVTAGEKVLVTDLPEGVPTRVEIADRAYIFRRAGTSTEVWPGVCPHEGAVIGTQDVGTATVKCSWHGLEFGRRLLAPSQPTVTVCGARLSLVDGQISILAE